MLAGVTVGGAALAQTEIDVRTIVSVPPQEEAPATPAPAAAADASAEPPAALTAPWDAPPFQNAVPSVAAPAITTPSVSEATASEQPAATTAGFTGNAAALPCRPAGYVTIIDERSDFRAGTLCPLADGSWQLLP